MIRNKNGGFIFIFTIVHLALVHSSDDPYKHVLEDFKAKKEVLNLNI